MVLIVLHGGGLSLDNAHLPGILAGTASGFGYAFMIILTRRLGQMLLHQKAVVLLLWLTTLVTAPVVACDRLPDDGPLCVASADHGTFSFHNGSAHVFQRARRCLRSMRPSWDI